MSKLTTLFIIAQFFLSTFSIVTIGFAQNNAEIVYTSFVNAINAGDAIKALAVFSDDIILRAGRECPKDNPCIGKQAAKNKYIDSQIAANTKIVPFSIQVEGNLVTAKVEIRNRRTISTGIDRIIGTDNVEIHGDKIKSYIFVPDLNDEDTKKFFKVK